MMSSLQDILQKYFESKSLHPDKLVNGNIDVRGLKGCLKPFFVQWIASISNHPVCIILPKAEEAEQLAEDLSRLYNEDKVSYFPAGSEKHISAVPLSAYRDGQQMDVLRNLLKKNVQILVTDIDGILQNIPAPSEIEEKKIVLSVGSNQDVYGLIEQLSNYGYVRETVVERVGEFSLRGGILDIYPFTGESPHRIEFWGDQIESMRTFDLETQRSTDKGDTLELIPAPTGWTENAATLLSYFPQEGMLFLEDPDFLMSAIESTESNLDKEVFSKELSGFRQYTHWTLTHPKDSIDLGALPVPHLGKSGKDVHKNLEVLSKGNQSIQIFYEDVSHRKRLTDFLDIDENPIDSVTWIESSLQMGIRLPEINLTIVTQTELWGHSVRKRRRRRFQNGMAIRELNALNKGDYVVHIDHGIGKYSGLQKITVNQALRECLTLIYQDGDKIYVPVEHMERVQKYSGKESAAPALSKLGSQKWEATKAKTKKAIQEIAEELIKLYSVRETVPGFAFSKDTTWQNEMENAFLYEETVDQVTVIRDIKQDMEAPKPMDRLICGDVGFGKTEVAIRAAFKAVNDSKQVAVLVPTTVLAQQHFQTFQERLASFPVRVEVLSRFRTKKEQTEVVEEMSKGKVDIVIGTHRLLSKDIQFKDLGLLIIDEEHRFGVKHKEKLKTLRENVDVLALSATPIPRTMHLSMMKIRDISIMTTPPKDRLPIVTEVTPFDESVVVEAIHRELARGGQIFFVHNRVRSILAVAEMIRRLVPGIRLGVAHGQMEPRELEKVMMQFMDEKYDCLVSTMIIESGLDMPHVNTLIIHRADRFGLAELYQLRGRVGRSSRRAYAYLLTPPLQLLSEIAMKRLRTVEEFTELGSGFQIAMRDLEIRGAGNLLGMQQSGYIDAVGFDLYQKLVKEAIENIQQGEVGEMEEKLLGIECQVQTEDSAFFPESYIPDESLRVNLYRRLAEIHDEQKIDSFEEELIDRFGPTPDEVKNLTESAKLRCLGEKYGIQRILIESGSIKFFFDEKWLEQYESPELFSEKLRSIIDHAPVPVRFLQTKAFGLRAEYRNEEPVALAKKILHRFE